MRINILTSSFPSASQWVCDKYHNLLSQEFVLKKVGKMREKTFELDSEKLEEF